MTLDTLTNCNCISELEKDMISESLQVNLHIIKDLLRNQTAKFKPDTALVKRFKGQQIFIKNITTATWQSTQADWRSRRSRLCCPKCCLKI